MTTPASPLPADDLRRSLKIARPNEDESLPHISLAGDTYTVLVTGSDSAGRYCLFDMHVPPGGGPPPHRHDFEELFTILEGEVEFTFRGDKVSLSAGQTASIPANAPHHFRNVSGSPARLLCLCSPAGLDEFFTSVGLPVPGRTTPPPPMDELGRAEFARKAQALAQQYRTEFV